MYGCICLMLFDINIIISLPSVSRKGKVLLQKNYEFTYFILTQQSNRTSSSYVLMYVLMVVFSWIVDPIQRLDISYKLNKSFFLSSLIAIIIIIIFENIFLSWKGNFSLVLPSIIPLTNMYYTYSPFALCPSSCACLIWPPLPLQCEWRKKNILPILELNGVSCVYLEKS